jgi:uncharacterized membrane protein
MYSKVKLLGHPVHPMLVSYPIALYAATVAGWILFRVQGDYVWVQLAIAANVAGVIMAAVAALPGFVDWAVGIPGESPAKRHGLIHMLLNVAALVLFLINMVIHLDRWSPTIHPRSALGFSLSLVGVLCTLAAGYFGWTMIQNDHVGVVLTPEQEKLERSGAGRF